MLKQIFLSTALLAAAVAPASAETLTLSYVGNEMATSAPIGIGMGDNKWIEEAFFIPASTVELLKGNKITGIQGYISSVADIETIRIWVRSDLEGEDLASYTLVPNQLNKVKKGYNKQSFKTPFEIPADYQGGLYIGFGMKITSVNARGLSATTTPIPGAFFLRRADGQWYDFSDRGATCVQAIIEGDNLPANNIHLSRVDQYPYFIMSKGETSPTFYVHNFGTQPIDGFDIKAVSSDGASEPVHVDLTLNPGMRAILPVSIKPVISHAGENELQYLISSIGGGTDEDMLDNSLIVSVTAAAHDYPRYVLSEEFTTEDCGNCPEVVEMIHKLLQKPEYAANIIQVCHHAGYKTDFLTEAWHTTFTGLYSGGTFAPGLCADRSQRAVNDIVFFPEDEDMITDLWNNRMATPALVSVNISARYADDEQTAVIVTVTGEKSVESICESPVINVMLLESDIPQVNQVSAGKDFVHDFVSRAVSAESHWGDPLTFDGDTYTYTCTIPLKEGWVKDNMQVVAYVGNNGKWNDKEIANAGRINFAEIASASVDVLPDGATAVSHEYYDLSGRRLTAPTPGVVIVRTAYSDGTVATHKQIVK